MQRKTTDSWNLLLTLENLQSPKNSRLAGAHRLPSLRPCSQPGSRWLRRGRAGPLAKVCLPLGCWWCSRHWKWSTRLPLYACGVWAPATTSITWLQGEYCSFRVGMQITVQGLIAGELEASFPKLSEMKGRRLIVPISPIFVNSAGMFRSSLASDACIGLS